MQKKPVERTCIACRKKGCKDEFIKIVINKDGNIQIEKDKKLDGRGAYVCKNSDCIKLCIKNKSLNKVLKRNIDAKIYEELSNELSN